MTLRSRRIGEAMFLWRSGKLARKLPPRDPPIGSPAPCASTRCCRRRPHYRHDPHRHPGKAGRQSGRMDGAGQRRTVRPLTTRRPENPPEPLRLTHRLLSSRNFPPPPHTPPLLPHAELFRPTYRKTYHEEGFLDELRSLGLARFRRAGSFLRGWRGAPRFALAAQRRPQTRLPVNERSGRALGRLVPRQRRQHLSDPAATRG